VTSIGDYAFSYCSNLTSVSIPSSVTSIGGSAFLGCSSLTSVTIPSGVKTIETGTFRNCSSLTSVTIPGSVTSIGGYAFFLCSSLTSVTIPGSVTSIEGYAFCLCSSLTSVTIGSSVRYIYSKAFASCPELTDVFCYAENVPTTEFDAFLSSSIDNATLHVPANSIEAYKAAEPWKNFKEIVPMNDESIGTIEYTSPSDRINIYSIDGKFIGSATDQNDAASIVNHLPSGTTAIVRIGDKSVKLVVGR
jgi:hypothetical protein